MTGTSAHTTGWPPTDLEAASPDRAVSPQATGRPGGSGGGAGLLVMDVDSTLINEEVIDLLAQAAGAGERVAALTAAAMRGELDFRQALAERVSLLAGLPDSVFKTVYHQVHFTRGALELIDRLHQRGWKVAVVSGGFHEVVDQLVARAGIDFALANRLESADGFLTGHTQGQIVDKNLKLATLHNWVAELGLTMTEVVAIGDGANDIPMIQAAGLGIAFCAKPVVRQAADARLDERDLLAALPLIEAWLTGRTDQPASAQTTSGQTTQTAQTTNGQTASGRPQAATA